uniref:Uncharacterized protein n=1 Tax=Knipowitschia caucasica TaxID=637954 RepID=A0AAV2JSQ3_KNICA
MNGGYINPSEELSAGSAQRNQRCHWPHRCDEIDYNISTNPRAAEAGSCQERRIRLSFHKLSLLQLRTLKAFDSANTDVLHRSSCVR